MLDSYVMERTEWLEERKKRIGASECAIVMGFSPWKSPLALYYEKTGEIEPEDISDKAVIKMGIKLEPVVAELFQENNPTLNFTAYGADKPTIMTNPLYPFMACSPDGLAVDEDNVICGVELKTTAEHNKADWADGCVPYHYQLQCQHSMAVTGFDRWYIACLIGGQQYVQTTVWRNEDLIDLIIEEERTFWDNVKRERPPECDGSESDWNVIKKLHPKSNGATIDLTEFNDIGVVDCLLQNYENLSVDMKFYQDKVKEIQRRQDEIKQELVLMLGDAERGVYGDTIVEYKTVERKEHVVKASNFRKFSIKKGAIKR